jgi:hypothetical protein
MRSEQEIRAALRSWILTKASYLDGDTLTDTTPLFADRHLQSRHLPELLLVLEKVRGAPIDVAILWPSDFRDIDTLIRRFAVPRVPS